MKKIISILTLAALAFTLQSHPASAREAATDPANALEQTRLKLGLENTTCDLELKNDGSKDAVVIPMMFAAGGDPDAEGFYANYEKNGVYVMSKALGQRVENTNLIMLNAEVTTIGTREGQFGNRTLRGDIVIDLNTREAAGSLFTDISSAKTTTLLRVSCRAQKTAK